MKVELELCPAANRTLIENLYPLYLHDISEFEGMEPNRHGVLGMGDDVTTLAEQGAAQGAWWRHPDALFPYLIRVDGRPAGFNLIAAASHFPGEIPADWVIYGFFLVHAWRGTAAAEQAVVEGLDRHSGRWEIVTYPRHARAIAFWRRTLGRYLGADLPGQELDHPWGRKLAFRFDNSGARGARQGAGSRPPAQ